MENRRSNVNKIVLLLLVMTISLLFLTMIRQFLMATFMAGLFAALVSPLHRRLSNRLGERENLASMITITGIILLVLLPLAALVGVVVSQAIHVGESITPWVQTFINEPGALAGRLENLPYYEQVLPYRDEIIQKAGQIVAHISSFLIDSLSSVTKLTISAVFNTVVMLYVMFYFLTMGDVLLEKILYCLPLEHHEEERLLQRFTSVTRATIKSTMIIGLLQGLICGIAFFLAAIQGPVFWGTVMAVMSIIPAFGTAIIWVPAAIILVLTGNYTGTVILLALCGGVAGNLDNLLRPRLVGKDTEMHDLFVLFGTLGGIAMFGLLGIIIGPIIAALFITIWGLYQDSFQEYLPEVKGIIRTIREKPSTDIVEGNDSAEIKTEDDG